jgi:threonine/homoserine/homoserine lactone efflux protein
MVAAARLRTPMSAAEFAALLAFATAMSFTPGPNTTLSAALAANYGLARALRFVVAVPVGWALLLLACVAGVGALLQAAPALADAIKLAGVAYMLWLAWQLARRTQLGAADGGAAPVGFAGGVALQFVNIKAWLTALTISATWLAVEGQLGLRLAQALPTLMAYALASNLLYACVGASLRGWLAQGRRLQVFNGALAALLAATALWMLAA